jgi:transcriptional regulator with XRE-family HTH domain
MEVNPINYIWKYRKRLGMGQKRVAYLLGHSDHSQFSKWERGESVPNLDNVLRLSYILQTPVEALYHERYKALSKDIEERQSTLPQRRAKVEDNELRF